MVVVGVVGIIAAVGVPALLSQLAKVELEGAAHTVANLMNQARQRAIQDAEKKSHSVLVVSDDELRIIRIVDVDDRSKDELAWIHQFTDVGTEIYTVGPADCVNTEVIYNATGTADELGRVCIHDGDDNIIEVAITSIAGQPKISKFLFGADSPDGGDGFFEKTSAATAGITWTWY